jgi:hypothetical protein
LGLVRKRVERYNKNFVNFQKFQGNRFSYYMLRNASHPKRKEYLDRFVAYESGLFIQKFYKKYSAEPQQKKMQLLQDAVGTSIHRLAALYRFVFPFKKLIPSYATAIGSSADRPEALAEILGIIINEGLHTPPYLIQEITFANNTPYHTQFIRKRVEPKKVLHAEIALIIKKALFKVVEKGTAKRVYQAFFNDEKTGLPVGGKPARGTIGIRRSIQTGWLSHRKSSIARPHLLLSLETISSGTLRPMFPDHQQVNILLPVPCRWPS